MAFALVSNAAAKYTSASSGATTGAIDTSGSALLVVGVSKLNTGTITLSDSKTNTWTTLGNSGTDPQTVLYYTLSSLSVGTGHTFSISGTNCFADICVAAFSNSNTVSFGAEIGNATTGISIQPGNITPPSNNALLVTACSSFSNSTLAINGSFNITNQQLLVINQCYSEGMAYLIQTSAAAANPTWSWATNDPFATRCSVRMASFTETAAGGTTVKQLAALGVG